MAHQAGPLRFKGKLGGLSFYHNKQYGYLVREKGGPNKEQIATSPVFARTRENAAEFALASSTGKLIRQAVRASTGLDGDPNVSQRFMGLLVRIGKHDLSSIRGMRNPVRVFDEAASRALLRSFAFYAIRPVTSVYTGQIDCDITAGTITFAGLISRKSFRAPKAATHVRIKAAIAVLDFENNTYMICPSPVYIAQLAHTMPTADFTFNLQSVGTGSRIGIVAIEFLQEKNEELYVLTEGVSLGIMG